MKKLKCLKCHKAIEDRNTYGLHTACFQKWFAVQDSSEFYDLDFKKASSYSSSPTVTFTKNKDSFYHGRYHKYSAKLGNQQYILKVEETRFPDLPAMEYLCNQIASHLGLKVPSYYLILLNASESKILTNQKNEQKSKNLMIFVTKNFMQNSIGSLNHIYKFLPKGGKNYNCQNIVNVIQQQTNTPNDIKKFVEICLFDAFIGNGDRHGRNLGIIDTGKNKKLAPMYDNPSNFGVTPQDMLGWHFNISGCIWTASSEKPKIKDYVHEFKRLHLKNLCLQFINRIIKQFPFLIEEVKKSEISEDRKTAFICFLNNRLHDLKSILKEG